MTNSPELPRGTVLLILKASRCVWGEIKSDWFIVPDESPFAFRDLFLVRGCLRSWSLGEVEVSGYCRRSGRWRSDGWGCVCGGGRMHGERGRRLSWTMLCGREDEVP